MSKIERRISTNGELYRIEYMIGNCSIWDHYSSLYNNYEQAQKALARLLEEDRSEELWKPVIRSGSGND